MRNKLFKTILALFIIGLIALITIMAITTENSQQDTPSADQNAFSTIAKSDFQSFVKLNRKFYFNQAEYNYRHSVYQSNIAYINEQNVISKNSGDKDAVILAANRLTDLTPQEFKKYYLGAIPPSNLPSPDDMNNDGRFDAILDQGEDEEYNNLPDHLDWEEDNKMTPVKDQGLCGACWAFATLAAVEALHKEKTNENIDLSEQQLVDCSRGHGNYGCQGGWTDWAYDYMVEQGVQSQESYPYVEKDGKCQHGWMSTTVIRPSGYAVLDRLNERQMKKAVKKSPISVAVNASSMQFYRYGVMRGWLCNPMQINHAVTIMGYGQTWYMTPYWKFKNSWGEEWGYNGYGYIKRSDSVQTAGTCGIAYYSNYPKID